MMWRLVVVQLLNAIQRDGVCVSIWRIRVVA